MSLDRFRSANRLALPSFRRVAEELETFLVPQTSNQSTANVTNTPSGERQDDDTKLSARFRQFIGRSGRMICIELSSDHPVLFKRLEAARKHVGGNAGETLLEILKAHGTGKKVPDN